MSCSRLDCSSVLTTMLRITLVVRLTRHSWNVACNTRCLQGFEEVRGRVLQCNYYVMKGWCRSSTGNGRRDSEFNLSTHVTYVRSYRAKFLQPFASARLCDDCKFWFSLGIVCDLFARDSIVKNNKYEEKCGNGTRDVNEKKFRQVSIGKEYLFNSESMITQTSLNCLIFYNKNFVCS